MKKLLNFMGRFRFDSCTYDTIVEGYQIRCFSQEEIFASAKHFLKMKRNIPVQTCKKALVGEK